MFLAGCTSVVGYCQQQLPAMSYPLSALPQRLQLVCVAHIVKAATHLAGTCGPSVWSRREIKAITQDYALKIQFAGVYDGAGR